MAPVEESTGATHQGGVLLRDDTEVEGMVYRDDATRNGHVHGVSAAGVAVYKAVSDAAAGIKTRNRFTVTQHLGVFINNETA